MPDDGDGAGPAAVRRRVLGVDDEVEDGDDGDDGQTGVRVLEVELRVVWHLELEDAGRPGGGRPVQLVGGGPA